MIKAIVNGKKRLVENKTSINDLILTLNLDNKRFAIEYNQEIITRSDYSSLFIKNGDIIEIIHAVGGG